MYWNVLVDKWFLCALIFCIICSIGFLLWQQNDMAKFKKKMEAHDAFIGNLENEKNDSEQVMVRSITSEEIEQDEWNENAETAFVNADVEKGPDVVSEKMQNDDTTDASSSKVSTPQARVSPYGFGPYPEIPEDFPVHNGKFSFKNFSKEHELLMRVWIKLWKQGERVEGVASGGNGLVYPIIQGKVYVEYQEVVSSDGTVVKESVQSLGHPDDFSYNNDNFTVPTTGYTSPSTIALEEIPSYTSDDMERGTVSKLSNESEIPSHLEILSFDEGIDPYEFLDLQ